MLFIKFRDVGNTEFIPHHNKYILGAAIAAGGSVLGGLLGFAGSSNAANKSLQATRETNKANRELAEYQNEWNLAQWNRQNAYNDPSAQRLRYEQAGINPYFALGNISSGNAQGELTSAPMANQQSGAESYNMLAQGYQNLGNSISNATQSFFGTLYQQEQLKALQIQNTENILSMKLRVNGLHYDNESKRMANAVYNANMQSLINMTKNQERESYARVAQANLQTVGTEYDIASKSFTNKFILPSQRDIAQMTIGKMVAEIAYQKAQERWTDKQTSLAAKYAAAAMLSANSSWLSSKAAWNTSLSNASSVESQNWFRTQQNSREATRFGIESKYLERSIKVGVQQLESQFNFQKHRENLWFKTGAPGRFIFNLGETFNQISPFKFGFGK